MITPISVGGVAVGGSGLGSSRIGLGGVAAGAGTSASAGAGTIVGSSNSYAFTVFTPVARMFPLCLRLGRTAPSKVDVDNIKVQVQESFDHHFFIDLQSTSGFKHMVVVYM